MTAKIKMRQYVIFIKPQKFDTADIYCFTVLGEVGIGGRLKPVLQNDFVQQVLSFTRNNKKENKRELTNKKKLCIIFISFNKVQSNFTKGSAQSWQHGGFCVYIFPCRIHS